MGRDGDAGVGVLGRLLVFAVGDAVLVGGDFDVELAVGRGVLAVLLDVDVCGHGVDLDADGDGHAEARGLDARVLLAWRLDWLWLWIGIGLSLSGRSLVLSDHGGRSVLLRSLW